jgi:hypothetical protein
MERGRPSPSGGKRIAPGRDPPMLTLGHHGTARFERSGDMPDVKATKEYEKAIKGVASAQKELISHQVEMAKMQAKVQQFHAEMVNFMAQIAVNPAIAGPYIQAQDKWQKAIAKHAQMQMDEGKLVQALSKASKALSAAAKAAGAK